MCFSLPQCQGCCWPKAWNCTVKGEEWAPTPWNFLVGRLLPPGVSHVMVGWPSGQQRHLMGRPDGELSAWASQATKRPDGQTDQNSHLSTSFLKMQKGCPGGLRRPNLVKKLRTYSEQDSELWPWCEFPTSSVSFSPPSPFAHPNW